MPASRSAGVDTPARLLFGIPEAAEALSLGDRTVWKYVQSGAIRSIRLGGRRLIPASALAEFVAGLLEAEAS